MAEQDYSALTVDQLKAELEERQLPKSGKKDDLIARLTEDDAAKAGTASEPDADAIAEGSENVEAPAEAAATDADATTAADSSDDEGAGDEDASTDDAEEAPKRRGSAETSGGSRPARSRDSDASPAPRDENGALAIRAKAKFVRNAPRKTRLVMDHIRGKDVAQARAILAHTPRTAATDVAKLLESAVANAENNFELDAEDLKVGRVFADEGPTIKRFRPRAQGRATPIHKRTSHMTIILTGKDA